MTTDVQDKILIAEANSYIVLSAQEEPVIEDVSLMRETKVFRHSASSVIPMPDLRVCSARVTHPFASIADSTGSAQFRRGDDRRGHGKLAVCIILAGRAVWITTSLSARAPALGISKLLGLLHCRGISFRLRYTRANLKKSGFGICSTTDSGRFQGSDDAAMRRVAKSISPAAGRYHRERPKEEKGGTATFAITLFDACASIS
ncbi:hypothetical protein DFH09DRAFT_1432358 [Mycena vulgaris]|nr:hypothetical protein DFH09DRAFT_1432358 [Mycena vulgaris]